MKLIRMRASLFSPELPLDQTDDESTVQLQPSGKMRTATESLRVEDFSLHTALVAEVSEYSMFGIDQT